MISKVKEQTRENIAHIVVAVVTATALGAFCWAAQYPLIVPLFLLFLAIHLILCRKADYRLFLHLGLLLALAVFTAHSIFHYTQIPVRYIPVAGVAILAMLLFNDLQLSFMMALASSLLVSLIVDGDFGMMITFFTGSLAGAYMVKDARVRGQVMGAGVFIGVVHVICLVLLKPDYHLFLTRDFAVHYLYPLAFNGFICAFLVIATLKIFEYLFGVLTNYSLLELADFNQPLLKRLILEAPGTYHHSLVVSNLAEAAADAIGANALLTRVGAYYHDIGKLTKAEYFTENQMLGYNKHDDIEPSISRLVIFNHVKEGVELARRHRINPAIADFIPQHHGTGLIYYFYQKALEDAKEDETVDEADFRYPGPKPQTRETAITLLADSVEGATRSLDEPNPTNIEETVKKVINNKFIDGQLDECNLTLQEINKISSTFTRILSAMYHARIKYPEKKNGPAKAKGDAKDAPDGRKPSEEDPD
ncbi:MAG: HDIG domain-containing protein [Candidatus Omnitrophica bacterium]|nr:HDIG domain-containing protein [Candidatus Omnitrophota bacterium]